MARPVADYLANFGQPASEELPAAIAISPPRCPQEEVPCEVSRAAILAVRQEALAQGLAAASKDCEERLTLERQAFENQLAAERERWTREESEMLCSKMYAAMAETESKIADCVTRILKPFITASARNAVISALAENIAVLVRGQHSPLVSLSGPEDLLNRLRERIALSAEFEYHFSDAVDIRVIAGETIIESQLAAFSARLDAPGE